MNRPTGRQLLGLTIAVLVAAFSMAQVVLVSNASSSDILLSVSVNPGIATTGTVVTITSALTNTASVARTVTLSAAVSYESFRSSGFSLPIPTVTLRLEPRQTITQAFHFTVSQLFPKGTYTVSLKASDIVGSTSASATLIVAALSSNCPSSTLVFEGSGFLAPGTSTALFQCAGGSATFSASGGNVVPTITGNTGVPAYTSVTIVKHLPGAKTCTAGLVLKSGVALNVPAGSYDYCLTLPSGTSGTFPSFSITWGQ